MTMILFEPLDGFAVHVLCAKRQTVRYKSMKHTKVFCKLHSAKTFREIAQCYGIYILSEIISDYTHFLFSRKNKQICR